MSIFKRDCPECAAANPPDALLCACGYCFDPDALAERDPVAYACQQERLYLEYLKARLAQAQADAHAAREAVRAEPKDKSKAVALRGAEAALTALRTELHESTRRVPAAPRAPACPARAAPVEPERPRPTPRPAAAPASGDARPDASFRRVQAQRANALVQSARAAAQPQRVAATSQAPALASSSAARREGAQTCPNCTATLAADAAQCRCGYAFPRPGDAVPALSLDADALAILADGIRFTGPARRR